MQTTIGRITVNFTEVKLLMLAQSHNYLKHPDSSPHNHHQDFEHGYYYHL